MTVLSTIAVAFYVVLLLAMLAYGGNCVLLVWIHRRKVAGQPLVRAPEFGHEPLPAVLIQLPIYNEKNVVGRLLEACAGLDWPADRLHIQLLDDSTDDTPAAAASIVERLRAQGHDISHVRRSHRDGFKAGALAHGLTLQDAPFVAIFDADFVPPAGFLRQAMGRFTDSAVAAVQGRWTHLNRQWSGLTRAQALAIDGHFGVEQTARCAAGWLMNFNGSGGIWRRAAIHDAGGWTADTLTEDLDLSYRAQLRGWRLVYDPELTCPCELPTTLAAFKAQQRRWATGSIQVAIKLLPDIWRAKLSLGARLQATLHMTHYAIHALIAATALLSVPCVLLPGAAAGVSLWSLLFPFALAMSGPTILYLYAQRALGQDVRQPLRDLGLLTLVGIGIAVSNAGAVLRAIRQRGGVFERTPKLGVIEHGDTVVRRYSSGPDGLFFLEGGLALYCFAAAVALIWTGVYVVAPFMLLDAAGLTFVALGGRAEVRR